MRQDRSFYRSPIGWIEVAGTARGVASLRFIRKPAGNPGPTSDVLRRVIDELREYFQGARREFTAVLVIQGTEFQKSVWGELRKIPFGKTATYGEVARRLGRPGAARAVGRANHLNPVSIIVPCHRVIGRDGGLTGYGGGLWRKAWLLTHEGSRPGETAAGWPARGENSPRRSKK